MSSSSFEIRPATAADEPAVVALLPRLAAFEVPNGRAPEELWRGDRDLVVAWAAGERPDVEACVATVDGEVRGVAVVSEREEMLSGEPSAHLEILAVDARAEGRGIGSALVAGAERIAAARGLGAMSLNVFAANAKARALYERCGFDGELVRYFKRLG